MPMIPDNLPSIGKATVVLLRQKGVSTAYDVLNRGEAGHDGIPGLGPAKWAVLWDWAYNNADIHERMAIVEGWLAVIPGAVVTNYGWEGWTIRRSGYAFSAFLNEEWLMSGPDLTDRDRQRIDQRLDQIEAAERDRIQVAQQEQAERQRLEAAEARRQTVTTLVIGIVLALAAWVAYSFLHK